MTDLGTEFGVSVSDPSTCKVHVFDGKVQVSVHSANDTPKQTQELTAGQMVQISGSGMHSIAVSGLEPIAVVRKRVHPSSFHLGANHGFKGIALQNTGLCVDRSLDDTERLRLSWNIFGHRGSAWYGKKQSVAQGFSTAFQFQFTYPQGIGGDGLAFVVQNTAKADKLRIGAGGSPTNALNVSIHSHQNAGDPSNAFLVAHDGEEVIGVFDLHTRFDFSSLADGRVHAVRLDYSPGSLDVRFDYVLVLKGLKVDLARLEHGSAVDADGKAWLGFAASTGEWVTDNSRTTPSVTTCCRGRSSRQAAAFIHPQQLNSQERKTGNSNVWKEV